MAERKSIAERFWSKVDRRGPSECWPWIACRTRGGYGYFRLSEHVTYAHRSSWILNHGPIPKGKDILHCCDNPPCVNPSHLRLGTHSENMSEMVSRGRSQRAAGEKHRMAKLSTSEVLEIRALSKVGQHTADRFGVSLRQIYGIRARTSWGHV